MSELVLMNMDGFNFCIPIIHPPDLYMPITPHALLLGQAHQTDKGNYNRNQESRTRTRTKNQMPKKKQRPPKKPKKKTDYVKTEHKTPL